MDYSLQPIHCDVCGANTMSPGTCSQCSAWAFDEEFKLRRARERANPSTEYWQPREDQVLRWHDLNLNFSDMARRFKEESAWG